MAGRRSRMPLLLIGIAAPLPSIAPARIRQRMQPQQLLYASIRVSDFERSRDFHTAVVGLKEIPGGASAAGQNVSVLSFSGNYEDSFLMISHAQVDRAAIDKHGPLQRVAFKVLDAKAIVARARAGNYAVVRDADTAHGMPGLQVAVLRDPGDNGIELVQTTDK